MSLYRFAELFQKTVQDFNAKYPEGLDTAGISEEAFEYDDRQSDDWLIYHGADLAAFVLDSRPKAVQLLRDLQDGLEQDKGFEQDGQSFTVLPAQRLAAFVRSIFGITDEDLED